LVPLWQFQGAQTHPETPALTDEVLRTDVVAGRTVYRSGDLVYRTDEGDYVYVDRADRVVKRMGVRISLVELGEALRRLEGVTAAVCVAYDDGGQLAIRLRDRGGSRIAPRHPSGRRRAAAGLDAARPDRAGAEPPLTRSSKVDERRLLAEAGPTPPAAGVPAAGADGRARAVGPPGQARPMTQRGRDQSCQYSTTS
jgi:D-alanine--poly(phosphoribitol) ligase subunit 1